MEWVESLSQAIRYMENYLLEDISTDDVANYVHMSPFYLQKGFRIITGYSIGEYIRYRRLYLSALDVIADASNITSSDYESGFGFLL